METLCFTALGEFKDNLDIFIDNISAHNFFLVWILIFLAHAKFQNPMTSPSGRKTKSSERRKKKEIKKNNA